MNRAILLAHPVYHLNNLYFIVNTLLDNGYPIELIFNKINARLKKLFATKLNNPRSINLNEEKNNRKIIAFSYIKNISKIVISAI